MERKERLSTEWKNPESHRSIALYLESSISRAIHVHSDKFTIISRDNQIKRHVC